MKKVLVPLALLATLAFASAAYALNVYEVTGSVTPTKSGTTKKATPVRVSFNYTIDTDNNQRPSPIKKYSILFAGLRVNTAPFAKCTFAQISANNSDAGCSSASRVGTGFIENATGAANNPADRSIPCNASLTVYNSGNNKAVIFVQGTPNSTNPRTKCAILLTAPIPASFVRSSTGTALEFRVPDSLLHPAPGLDNAVTRVTSTINRLTKKVKGKTVGFFESTGGCKASKRAITVTFTPEQGQVARSQHLARCSS